MSAVYKVMEQMQKTRPRRLRGNREVMLVMGGIIIVGMLLLVNTLNKRLAADHQRFERPSQTGIQTGAVGQGRAADQGALVIQVSLNETHEWVIEGQGALSKQELSGILAAKRVEADEQGLRAIVRAQIDGSQPAKHFMELHRVAEQCGMDEVSVVTREALFGDEGG